MPVPMEKQLEMGHVLKLLMYQEEQLAVQMQPVTAQGIVLVHVTPAQS